jgi:hypothetical protein
MNKNKYKTISEIIHCEYLESDAPELLISESPLVEKILKIVFEDIKGDLKKSFKKKEVIDRLRENQELIETIREMSDNLLYDIDGNYGKLKISEEQEQKIDKFWDLKTTIKQS